MESGLSLKEVNDSIATTLQGMVADELEQQAANTLAAIAEIVEKAVELHFRTVTPSSQGGIHIVLYNDMVTVIIHQIWTAGPEETIEKHVDKYFRARKATEALGKMLHIDNVIAGITLFVQG